MGVVVEPPDINSSMEEFSVADGKIRFGLSAIKGCGGAAAGSLVAERAAHGPYKSLFDFCERLDPGMVNRTAIESLIKAGAFDSIGGRRSAVFAAIDRALQSGASAASDRKSGQRGLFEEDDEPAEVQVALLPDLPEWEEKDKLAKEKEVLGFYLSSHPLAEHVKTLKAYCSHTTVEAAALDHRSEVMLGGMIGSIKFSNTKNPKPGSPSRYAMFDLEDTEGIMRTICWPEQFAQFESQVLADAIVVIRGSIDKRPGSTEANFIVNEVIRLEDLAARYTRGVLIRVQEDPNNPNRLPLLREILRGYPGPTELQLLLCLANGHRVTCKCSDVKVAVNPELRTRIDDLLGPNNFRLLTAPPSPSKGSGGNGNNWRRG
jgi:DNA polymerase-3 subunit alpha